MSYCRHSFCYDSSLVVIIRSVTGVFFSKRYSGFDMLLPHDNGLVECILLKDYVTATVVLQVVDSEDGLIGSLATWKITLDWTGSSTRWSGGKLLCADCEHAQVYTP